MIAVQVTCMNFEYESLDEYVFSIKKSANDYNDFHVILLKSRATVHIRLALKVILLKVLILLGPKRSTRKINQRLGFSFRANSTDLRDFKAPYFFHSYYT